MRHTRHALLRAGATWRDHRFGKDLRGMRVQIACVDKGTRHDGDGLGELSSSWGDEVALYGHRRNVSPISRGQVGDVLSTITSKIDASYDTVMNSYYLRNYNKWLDRRESTSAYAAGARQDLVCSFVQHHDRPLDSWSLSVSHPQWPQLSSITAFGIPDKPLMTLSSAMI